MKNRNEAFGRLLKAGIASIANCEGKTAAVVEEELGTAIGVSADTIQRYKSGFVPPEAQASKLLAEAAVRRGFLGREWLQRFLHAARYPFADKLLDALCPAPQVRPRPPRVYENLPAPTYSQFVMREQAFAEVSDGLGKRSAAVLIVGMGGNGKTSLAREVAAHCLREDGETRRFDAVVWVSDKDRPGTTNLTTVLDEVARTLDYPGFTQYEYDEKRREVEQLLRRQRVLLVVDNFETITDGALLTWLLNLPEPSKALVTTREYRREFRRSSWPVELRGMSEAEVRTLIDQRLRQLRIAQLVGNVVQLEPLITATGGNPKAIEITLGLVKHERRPLQQVVDDLYAARGDLFDDLFARAWALLDEASRRVLLVATFFPTSASGDALRASADVQGFAFDRAVERLADMALLDIQQVDLSNPARYALHPLVRAFAGAKLTEQRGFEEGARERWVGWYTTLAQQVGWAWNNLQRLRLLDPEHEVIYTVAQHLYQYGEPRELINLINSARYFYYIRGYWKERLELDMMLALVARNISNTPQEVKGLSSYIRLCSRQNRIEELKDLFQRLQSLRSTNDLPGDILYEADQASALYATACDDLITAENIWRSMLYSEKEVAPFLRIANKKWLGLCLLQQGCLDEANDVLSETLQQAVKINYEPTIVAVSIAMANIAIKRGQIDSSADLLSSVRHKALEYQDRGLIAELHLTYARIHTLRGDIPAARASLADATDLFERLGMRRELAEARQALADLDRGAAADAHAAA